MLATSTPTAAAKMDKVIETLTPLMGRQACDELRVEGERLMKFGRIEHVDIDLPGKPFR